MSTRTTGLLLSLAVVAATAVSTAQAADKPARYAQAATAEVRPVAAKVVARAAAKTVAKTVEAKPVDAKAAAKAAVAKAAEAKAAAKFAEAKAAEAKAAEANAAAKAAAAKVAEVQAAQAQVAETRAAAAKAAARAAAAIQADPATGHARAARTRFIEARVAMGRALMLPETAPTTNIIALEVAMHGLRRELEALEQVSPAPDAVKKAADLAQDWYRAGSKIANPPTEGVLELPMSTTVARKANAAATALDQLIAEATARAAAPQHSAETVTPQRPASSLRRRVHIVPVASTRTAASVLPR